MTAAQRKEVDRMVEEGQTVHQGVMPDLDPEAVFFAEVWSDLRSCTPGDHPISLWSVSRLADEAEMPLFHLLPLVQVMDRAYFESQQKRLEKEREKRASKSHSRAPRARRGR